MGMLARDPKREYLHGFAEEREIPKQILANAFPALLFVQMLTIWRPLVARHF